MSNEVPPDSDSDSLTGTVAQMKYERDSLAGWCPHKVPGRAASPCPALEINESTAPPVQPIRRGDRECN
jgi:hypothetical protein